MGLSRQALTWLFQRFPLLFSIFLIILYVYSLTLAGYAASLWGFALADWLVGALRLPHALSGTFPVFRILVFAFSVLLAVLLSGLLSYQGAAWIYRWRRQGRRPPVAVQDPYVPRPGTAQRLDDVERIGIILGGGGAKGAYQAGAMKAIYEFLEENGSLSKVRAIAGTSIGSWNALFWLGGMIKQSDGERSSAHEEWWRSISLERIMEFAHYVPLRTNYLLYSTPWQEMFDDLFVNHEPTRERFVNLLLETPPDSPDPRVHFYFTRSNVEQAYLEFTTNWGGVATLTRPNFRGGQRAVVDANAYRIAKTIQDVKSAVFASMDLPPLFPYMTIRSGKQEWFEDGGVIDNVPIRFGTELENCDLLFVLPLNATFARPVDHNSIAQRLFRVMEIRQAVLERNSFRLAHMYNEMAGLRARIQQLESKLSAAGSQQPSASEKKDEILKDLAALSIHRKNKPVRIFAISPSLAGGNEEQTIGTVQFWKSDVAGHAFQLMYDATKNELAKNFEEDTNPTWLRMTVVPPQGEPTHLDDF